MPQARMHKHFGPLCSTEQPRSARAACTAPCRAPCQRQRRLGRRLPPPSRAPPLPRSAWPLCSVSRQRQRQPGRKLFPRWQQQLGRLERVLWQLPGQHGPGLHRLRLRRRLSLHSAMTKAALRNIMRPSPPARASLPQRLSPSLARMPAAHLPLAVLVQPATNATACQRTLVANMLALPSCRAASGLLVAACWAVRLGRAAQAGRAATARPAATIISTRPPMASGECPGGSHVCWSDSIASGTRAIKALGGRHQLPLLFAVTAANLK